VNYQWKTAHTIGDPQAYSSAENWPVLTWILPTPEAIAGISVELWNLLDARAIFRIVEIDAVIQVYLKSGDSRRPTMNDGFAISDEP